MIKGEIVLYSPNDTVLRHTTYFSVKFRKEVLESWKHLYGHLFNECYYQISPVTGAELTKENGNNKTGRPIKTEVEKSEAKNRWWKRSGRYPGSPLHINGHQGEGFSKQPHFWQ